MSARLKVDTDAVTAVAISANSRTANALAQRPGAPPLEDLGRLAGAVQQAWQREQRVRTEAASATAGLARAVGTAMAAHAAAEAANARSFE